MARLAGMIGSAWGALGVFLLLTIAILRLGPVAWSIFEDQLLWHHWLALILISLLMGYFEGYRGFQLKFCPRVAARCRYLKSAPQVWHLLFAPLFCMGFFHTTRTRQITSLALASAILLMVQLVREFAQPWRGIIDAGVLVGLIWGLASLCYFVTKALTAEEFSYSAELPQR